MKQLLLAAGAIALTVGTAVAQDQVYDWSGAYMGVQAGYGWGKAKYISPEDGQSASPRPDGFLGGIYGGYNHQFANDFVLGIEGDVNISDSDGVSLFGPWPAFDSKFELKWSGAARIRLGYAVGRFLPFVAGGATAGRIIHDYAIAGLSPRVPRVGFEGTELGWTVGAGVEYALTDKISTRVEYRYTDYGSKNYPDTLPALPHSMSLKTSDLRIGIAYKF